MTLRTLAGSTAGAIAIVLSQIPAGSQSPAAVTFSKDVAPIFNKNCVGCHRDGEIAPMALTSYEAARPWARSIRQKVTERAMPPWGAEPGIGQFANDPRLTDKDVATIAAWVDGGTVEGNPKDLPILPALTGGWKIGKPDIVVSMTAPAEVPATGTRIIRDYAIDPITFNEDTYVERMEVVPSNRAVTHHAIVSVREGSTSNRIGGYQPGGAITTYPQGMVRLIPKGSSLNLNMHYNPTGKPELDKTTIALVLVKKPAELNMQVVMTAMSGTRSLDIPAGAANYEAKGNAYVFEQDSHIVSLLPRMNERGKDYKYTLTYPDGRSVVLLSVPKFNPDWQPSYVLKAAIAAPKGSRIETLAHYDNSTGNKYNPDPTVRVPYGPEIMNGYFDYTVDKPAARQVTGSTASR